MRYQVVSEQIVTERGGTKEHWLVWDSVELRPRGAFLSHAAADSWAEGLERRIYELLGLEDPGKLI